MKIFNHLLIFAVIIVNIFGFCNFVVNFPKIKRFTRLVKGQGLESLPSTTSADKIDSTIGNAVANQIKKIGVGSSVSVSVLAERARLNALEISNTEREISENYSPNLKTNREVKAAVSLRGKDDQCELRKGNNKQTDKQTDLMIQSNNLDIPSTFSPVYSISPRTAKCLMRIEDAKEKVCHLPLSPGVLSSLREAAKLASIHYSTQIEGNRLDQNQVAEVLLLKRHFPGRERDEREVRGYFSALAQLDKYVAQNHPITEKGIQTLHALVMSNGRTSTRITVPPTPYRDGQNVIRNSATGTIVYMPPEASDVQSLMRQLVAWINDSESDLPCPVVAAIAHYQFATIHPYYDGNGRTARLLTALILHLGGYDLKGLYSLEEYYAENLPTYYREISVGPSHNYYFGRMESDVTGWVDYFIEGMAFAVEKAVTQVLDAQSKGQRDPSDPMIPVGHKQPKVLEQFKQ